MNPVATAAALLVDRLDLRPPVDVHTLVQQFAEFEVCSWPSEYCFGVAVLSGDHPRVFISTKQGKRRARFTVAHELAHVLLGWHIDTVRCHPVPEDDNLILPADGVDQEREANEFASHLLVPDRFLDQFGNAYHSVPELLDELSRADVSAAAGILALRRVLLPGYIFEVPGLKRLVVSDGTRRSSQILADLRRTAVAGGVHLHQDQPVTWLQMTTSVEPPAIVAEPVDPTRLLVSMLEELGLGDNRRQVVQSVNGIIGLAFGKARSGDPRVLMGVLEHKFGTRSGLGRLPGHPRFKEYLWLKAAKQAEKNRSQEVAECSRLRR